MKTTAKLLLAGGLLLAVSASGMQPPLAPSEPPAPLASPTATTQTRLYKSLRSNDLVAVKRLLRQRCDLNVLYQPPLLDVRATAYHAAPFLYWALLFHCRREILQALVAAGADVSFRFQEPEDVSLLMLTAYQFPAASVRFLLEHGAPVNAQTRSGRTALMFAVTNDDSTFGPTYGANHVTNVALLLARGARIDVRNSDGRTAAMVAALNYENSAATLALLLAHGARVNEADSSGATPLMFAAQPANLDAVTLLLRHGANVKARDRQGQTTLMWALYPHCGKSDLSGVIATLCQAGANVNARDRLGRTALDYVTGWEERLDEGVPVLKRFHAVHGTNLRTETPPP